MNTGGEVAGIVAGVYADLGKKGIELGSKLLSYILLGVLKSIEGKMNTGQISIKRMLESGDELKQIKLNKKDALQLTSKAIKSGLTFSIMDEPDKNGQLTYIFKAKDIEIIETLLKSISQDRENGIEEKVDKSILDEYIVNSNREIFIADKNNPDNYISANIEKNDIQKGYIINPKNPDEYIIFDENIKEKSLSIEINNSSNVVKYDTSNSEYSDIKSKISSEIERWGGVELVYTEEERLKYKEMLKEEKIKKEEKGDKKTMQEVEKEVKNIRNSQPRENSKTKIKSEKEKSR